MVRHVDGRGAGRRRGAVHDDGGASTRPRVVQDALGEQQRGLELVSKNAAGWEFTDLDDGRVVQAECAWAAGDGPIPELLPSEQQAADFTTALAAWFPDVPIWCGLDGWLALLPLPIGLVSAESPTGLRQAIARELAPSAPSVIAAGS